MCFSCLSRLFLPPLLLLKVVFIEFNCFCLSRSAYMIRCYLLQGLTTRKASDTKLNKGSSRSHAMFRYIIQCKLEHDSKVNCVQFLDLIDLAGSESYI